MVLALMLLTEPACKYTWYDTVSQQYAGCLPNQSTSARATRILLQAYTQPEQFDPDRFSNVRKEDIKFQRNFLTFGCGPHYCVGREYATNHLIVYLAILATR